MKKIIYGILATLSGLVLVFSYRTSLEAVAPTSPESAASGAASGVATDSSAGSAGSSSTGSASGSTDTSSGSASSGSTGVGSGAAAASGLKEGTYTGTSVNTRYGPVQVQILVAGGQISDVQVVDYPNSNGRDQQINQFAIPRLVSETVAAQSSQIDMVSGATYTSNGYITSLQSAIDQALS